MKRLVYFLAVALIFSSCGYKNEKVICRVEKDLITVINGSTTLTVDDDINFSISYRSGNEDVNLTVKGNSSSVLLLDSEGSRLSFKRTNASVAEINDDHGKGKKIEIEAQSADKTILGNIMLSSWEQHSEAIMVQASFRNNSGTKFTSKGYVLNNIKLQPPEGTKEWWSFQGAAYHWGLDFAFPLPDSFRRENHMGLNEPKSGAGIPVIDFWNKEYGVALASVSERPELVSLPVNAANGIIDISIKDTVRVSVIDPGESITTVKTAIIVHRGDFYEPLKKYSALMRPLLTDFQKPDGPSYQPEWCTWGYRQSFTLDDILRKTDTFHNLGMKSVILDDGWSVNHGDWVPDPKKFPKGDEDYKKLVNTLHENRLKVWIWWLPGYVDSTTAIAKVHRDWLIQNQDGSIHEAYGLCPAYEPVQEHYRDLVRKFVVEYKLDGLKLDFGEINSAAPCYNPAHNHKDPYESFYSTPLLFKNIFETAKKYNPEMLIEYCSCSIPPNIFHLPYMNLAVTSDPNISQITRRIKMYKALISDDFPVLEEYCGVLSGPTYQLAIGTGGVPGTFSAYLDGYHKKWLDIYNKYQLSRGHYLNLYDIGFDYPEGHAIEKDGSIYYAFYTHPWKQIEAKRWWRFGMEWDSQMKVKREAGFPAENYSGKLELRGLDKSKKYQVLNYENDMDIGMIDGKNPAIDASFENYILLKVTPVD